MSGGPRALRMLLLYSELVKKLEQRSANYIRLSEAMRVLRWFFAISAKKYVLYVPKVCYEHEKFVCRDTARGDPEVSKTHHHEQKVFHFLGVWHVGRSVQLHSFALEELAQSRRVFTG
jgi:hypothetical protein